jgi:cytochrome c oxidase subunit 2
MKILGMGMRRLTAAVGLALLTALSGCMQAADRHAPVVGRPVPGAFNMQPGASEVRYHQIEFHDNILMPIIVAISVFVLLLLLWVMIRYNKKANPTPARWSHNTFVEIIWTVVPVLVLMFIAIFSFPLLFEEHQLPERPYLTVKATGYQWYWGYAYPDQKIDEITSNLLPKEKAGDRYILAADNPMVVPVNRLIRVQVTGADVIHSFSVSAFGVKIDAVPGRLNETYFKADKIGKFYGQCAQLCGLQHTFMPIEVDVVSDADFATWVAAHHGVVSSATPPPAPTTAAVAAAPAANSAAPAASNAAAPANAASNTVQSTAAGAKAGPAAK